MIQQYSIIPDTTFYMRERDDSLGGSNPFKWSVKTAKELFANQKVVIFGLPGAFTPTCTNSQLPSYEMLYNDFLDRGIDEVWCTSVNDAFVMYQWAESLGIKKVKMLPDGNGDFARALGALVDKSNLGFGMRSWRYAMIVDDMEVVYIAEEPGEMDICPLDPYEVTDATDTLQALE